MAVLQGISFVSAMSLGYVQLACIVAVTQGGRRVNNLFYNKQAAGHADSFLTGGQDRNLNTEQVTELRVAWLQVHTQNLLPSWRGFGTVVTLMVYEHMLYMHNSSTPDKVPRASDDKMQQEADGDVGSRSASKTQRGGAGATSTVNDKT